MADFSLAAIASSIPDTVWAAIVASGITLFGVYLANRNSRRQLRMQLDHATNEATRKRTFEMRQAVYLGGGEAVARATGLVARMNNLALADEEIIKTSQDTAASFAKVLVVGDMDTVSATVNFETSFAESMGRLGPWRWDLIGLKQQLDEVEQQLRRHVDDQSRWLELLKQINVEAPGDKRFQRVTDQFKLASEGIDQILKRRSALQQRMETLGVQALEAVFRENVVLAKAIPPALERVRAELGLSGDVAQFHNLQTAQFARLEACNRTLLAEVQKRVVARKAASSPEPGGTGTH
jgi:hypothetical protein